jgi:hypothetical protein
MQELKKPAGKRCRHQRHGKGCAIYPRRPPPCAIWSCRWLVRDDTNDIARPDRAHFVIDIMPDYVRAKSGDGEEITVPAIQVWVDPAYPDAHRDPALRRYLERRSAEGFVAVIRYDANRGFVLVPPALAEDGTWHEVASEAEGEHTGWDIVRTLAGAPAEHKQPKGTDHAAT